MIGVILNGPAKGHFGVVKKGSDRGDNTTLILPSGSEIEIARRDVAFVGAGNESNENLEVLA